MIASPDHICADIQNSLMESGLFSRQAGDGDNIWRISPDPFHLSPNDAAFFQDLGQHLLKFYTALNQLYFDSVKGRVPAWVADYMDRGKPAELDGVSFKIIWCVIGIQSFRTQSLIKFNILQ